MRYGFTTGSCAAAAAKAAAYMLLTGRKKTEITIETPKGTPYQAEILDIKCMENKVLCAVEKNGGDDTDITTGTLIYAAVSYDNSNKSEGKKISIEGGTGVGRVTRPGLDQPIGNAAINNVPRKMIEKEVTEVCVLTDYEGSLLIEISVPQGEELAVQTFNSRLGIIGGISILGTTGIVEPMSSQALLDTIGIELRQHHEEGGSIAAVSPGNYGLEFMKQTYNYDLNKSVKCSNFIGKTIDMAIACGYESLLLTGHIGKLIKVSGGIMNTHSKEGDCRMELLAVAAIRAGIDIATISELLDCVSTEEALMILKQKGKLNIVMELIMEKIIFYLEKRAAGKLRIGCILYANEFGELAKSTEAAAMLEELMC